MKRLLIIISISLVACKKETIPPPQERVISTEQINRPPWKNIPKLDSAYLTNLFKRFRK